ncbi:MAG: class I SAM-dependent methyltransferase [Pseudomonadota bacterium]
MVTASSSDLPLPSAAARAHSARLCAHIAAQIAQAGGSIGFDRYMELALYAPGLGYYSAGAAKFGAEGDFVTAPELTPLFGRTLAAPCGEWLAQLGPDAWMLELGAGSGVLAADVLSALAQCGRLPATYAILERSAELRERQRQLLQARVPDLLDRVRWLDGLPDAPIEGVLLANEVLDALPVVRAHKTGAGWMELRVGGDAEQGFADVLAPASPELAGQLEAIEAVLGLALPPGYTTELQPWLPAWMASLGASFSRGAMLWIDYGLPRHQYYHPERASGTLRCHYRHRALDDPYRWPGLQDITAWVDFTALAEAAQAAGWVVDGYTTQAAFLIGAGIESELAQLDPVADYNVLQRTKRLLMPGEMGEAFKVMALAKGELDRPPALALFDQRARLWPMR